LHQVDVTAGFAPPQFHNPSWAVGGDLDRAQAESTRRKVYDQHATDRLLMSGYHISFPSLGYIEKAGTGYPFVPAGWTPIL
jgi:hypothetical protein